LDNTSTGVDVFFRISGAVSHDFLCDELRAAKEVAQTERSDDAFFFFSLCFFFLISVLLT